MTQRRSENEAQEGRPEAPRAPGMTAEKYYVERVDHDDGEIAYEIIQKNPHQWLTAFSETDLPNAKSLAEFFCHAANESLSRSAQSPVGNGPHEPNCIRYAGLHRATECDCRRSNASPASAEVSEAEDNLSSDCPPHGYPTDETRCAACPRRALAARRARG